MLNKRIISAIVALPILFAAVIFSDKIFFAFICIITLIGLMEYFKAVSHSDIKPMSFIGIIFGILIVFLIFIKDSIIPIVPVITLFVMIILSLPIFVKKYNYLSAGVTIIGTVYVALFFGYLYLIRAIPEKGVYFIWFVFICAWITDTFAYFSGMLFGKTKLCPLISPKKTVEGSIGGIIGCTVICSVYGLYLNSISIMSTKVIYFVIIGIVGSIISQFGDLVASSIKRTVGIKDYGKIMPGHGGVLDRFDSILFVAPLIYYYIIYIILR